MDGLLILLAFTIITVLVMGIYNSLIRLRNRVENA